MSERSDSELDCIVAEAADAEPCVLAAYLFGSRARGEGRAGSDLDVAVLEVPGMRLGIDAEERLRMRIRAATQLAVDITLLRDSAPVLAFEVLEGGRRVYARDPLAADEIEERLLRTYLDTEHLRRVQREYFFGER